MAWGGKKKLTRRERFLTEMDAVMPWNRLVALIEPHYPKGETGRPPKPLATMLGMPPYVTGVPYVGRQSVAGDGGSG